MAGFNRVILMGNLTRDPELRNLPNSDAQVRDFALAVNRKWTDANGNQQEEVLFIDCTAFGRTGQTIGENLTRLRMIHFRAAALTAASGALQSGAMVLAYSFCLG